MACGMGGATYAVRVFSWNDHSDHMADKKVELKAERRAEALERRERRAARNAAAQRPWLKIERGVISPTYRYVKSFAVYIREKRLYRITLILIWLYNFNLFTIFLETFAYAFYFPIAAIDSVNGVKAYSPGGKVRDRYIRAAWFSAVVAESIYRTCNLR